MKLKEENHLDNTMDVSNPADFAINKGKPFEFFSDPLDDEDSTAPFGSYTKCSPQMCIYCPYEICPLTGCPK